MIHLGLSSHGVRGARRALRLFTAPVLALALANAAACSTPMMGTPDGEAPADVTMPGEDATTPDGESPDAPMPGEDGEGPDASMPDAPPGDAPEGMGADWGFRPMVNGFGFENYSNMPVVTNLTADEVRRLFGPQVCEGAAATGACTLTPQARQWMEQQNTGMNGGHCEGLAVLASHFYSGALSAADFGNATTNSITLAENDRLQREVALWFTTQVTLPTLEQNELTPVQVVEQLEREFARGRSFRGTVLGLYTSPGRQNGHAVTPYAVRRPAAGIAEILAYDNNYPNQEKVIAVNLTANTFNYVTSTNPMESPLTYAGDAMTRTLTLANIEPRLMLPHACTFCGDAEMMSGTGSSRGSVQVSLTGQGDLSISDGMGHTTGADAAGMMVNSIPGAMVTRVRTNDLDLDSPEPLYTVPRQGTMTITLDGSRLRAASQSEILITGTGFSLGIEDLNLDPMQRDTVTFRTDAPDVTYRATGAETPTLVLAFQRPGADYLVELRSRAMTAGQALRLAVDLNTQRVRVSFDGSTSAPMFELYMERVTDTGVTVFRHAGVSATASSVLSLSYAAWTGDGAALHADIDTNGDGTADDTEEFSDEP